MIHRGAYQLAGPQYHLWEATVLLCPGMSAPELHFVLLQESEDSGHTQGQIQLHRKMNLHKYLQIYYNQTPNFLEVLEKQ